MNSRKPRIILAATGCVAALYFHRICRLFNEWAEVRVILTKAAERYVDRSLIPRDVPVYTERSLGFIDKVQDREQFRKWGDAIVIAPMSITTLCKLATRVRDNFLTKLFFEWNSLENCACVAPSISSMMRQSDLTDDHMTLLDERGVQFIPPRDGRLAQIDYISEYVQGMLEKKGLFFPVPSSSTMKKNVLIFTLPGDIDNPPILDTLSEIATVMLVGTKREHLNHISKDIIRHCDEADIPFAIREDNFPTYLIKWADVLVIISVGPISLGEIAGRRCHNMLTKVVYGWDCTKKPLIIVPQMTSHFCQEHITEIQNRGVQVILPKSGDKAVRKDNLVDIVIQNLK